MTRLKQCKICFVSNPCSHRPRPRWRGFSFALHLLRVQGFYFTRLQYANIQALTTCFVPLMQLYNPRHKTAHRALQELFRRFIPFYRPRYQTGTSGYNTACAALERTHVPGRPAPIPDTNATPDAGQVSGAAYYNKVYKERSPVMDPCQTVQHTADHSSPAGSAPTACGSLASAAPGAPAEGSASPPVRGQRLRCQSGKGQPGTLHPAGQSSGTRRAARNH